ncbi:MAG: 2-amino-4-hydroxy-6-hydroxymethyldihydropteridine diphosphokinase [Hyphomonadaceae bacterium]
MTEVAVGLGANLGDRCGSIIAALKALDQNPDVTVTRVSSIYATPPWGIVDQPAFLNAAALVETSLSPEALLDVCQDIERELGRRRRLRWGPREIDIDLLNIEGVRIASERLILPHAGLFERLFVLVPLHEIWGDRLVCGTGLQATIDRLRNVDEQSGIHLDDAATSRTRAAF